MCYGIEGELNLVSVKACKKRKQLAYVRSYVGSSIFAASEKTIFLVILFCYRRSCIGQRLFW